VHPERRRPGRARRDHHLLRDREPAGPYRFTVQARRTSHLRFNDMDDPEPIPKGTDFASVIESDVPVVVQHTRLDSRQSENALLSTIAFAGTASARSVRRRAVVMASRAPAHRYGAEY
jgi:hypothetical protein